jgi:hypothetical protein
VFCIIGYLLSVRSSKNVALSASVILVVMKMKGVTMKMMNPTTMTTIKNITMMGTKMMDRKLHQFEI